MTSAQIYAHLEAVVLPVLEAYQTDLTTCDRTTLAGYQGPFLLSYRPMGTNLLVLGPVREFVMLDDRRPAEIQVRCTFDRKRAEVAWEAQTHFLYYDGADFKQLSRAQALAVTDEHLARTLTALKTKSPC